MKGEKRASIYLLLSVFILKYCIFADNYTITDVTVNNGSSFAASDPSISNTHVGINYTGNYTGHNITTSESYRTSSYIVTSSTNEDGSVTTEPSINPNGDMYGIDDNVLNNTPKGNSSEVVVDNDKVKPPKQGIKLPPGGRAPPRPAGGPPPFTGTQKEREILDDIEYFMKKFYNPIVVIIGLLGEWQNDCYLAFKERYRCCKRGSVRTMYSNYVLGCPFYLKKTLKCAHFLS